MICCSTKKTQVDTNDLLQLKYDKPAKEWTEALPIGNGRQGAMIFGDALGEHLQLNENTMYSGEPSSTYNGTDVRPTYDEVMKLLAQQKYEEAEKVMAKNWLGGLHQCYQPFGDLLIDIEGDSITDYQRTLDLVNSLSTVSYSSRGVNFKRETFASNPDQVVVVRLEADKKSEISFETYLESIHPSCLTRVEGNTIIFTGQLPGFVLRRDMETVERNEDQHKYPDLYLSDGTRKPNAEQVLYGNKVDSKGMFFEARVEIRNKGGKLNPTEKGLQIVGADEVVILLSMATSFNGYDKSPSREGKDPAEINKTILSKLDNHTYDQIKFDHLADYHELFDRVKFDLKSKVDFRNQTTDVRLKNYTSSHDPALNALLFHYGRYLLISGSRKGGQPLNLQGIWNRKVIPSWNSAYTMNINAEMNYWPAEVTNLPECHQPLFNMVKELAVNGKETAKNMYGGQGWVAHHNTDIWRMTSPADNAVTYSYWPMGAGWLTSHLWEHYQYTKDHDFLEKEVYPLIKGAAEFYMSWLIENEEGYWVTPVGTSPENRFITPSGGQSSVSPGCTMDMAIIKENFERVVEASAILGVDTDFRKEIQDKYNQLLPYRIGRQGQLQEWQYDFEETNSHHRHLSHLYGFHPSDQITKEETPELFDAVRKTLELRGDEATGWSMGWKINFWARMRDGNHAYKIINNLFRFVDESGEHRHGGLYANFFDAHPPFQIDGNFGYTAGVAEMLLQSHSGELHILPALPDAWPTGHVSGLKARGNIEVDISWEEGGLKELSLRSSSDRRIRVRYMGTVKEIDLIKGEKILLDTKL